MGQKRQRDPKGLQGHANKKKKAGNSGNATNNGDSSDGFVGLDQLNWKSVPLPDRLEDVTGFFGLEEIDNVDVVRPEGSGEIRFKVKSLGQLSALQLTWIRPSLGRREF